MTSQHFSYICHDVVTTTHLSPSRVLYGILYGGVVAGAYLFVRLRGHDGGLVLFGLAGTVIFGIHLLVWPTLTLAGLVDREMVVRGLLFGLTQVLIFKAQSSGYTSTALVASTMGSVFGVILGRVLLKERIQGLAILAALCCFAAVFLHPQVVFTAYWGVVGGFIQGCGFVLSRSMMRNEKSVRQSISTGFAMAAFVTLGAHFIEGGHVTALHVLSKDLFFVILIATLVQYAFFHLYTILDSQRASMLVLSRLPWALILEQVVLGSGLSVIAFGDRMLSSLLIAGAAMLLLVDARNMQLRTLSPRKRETTS